MIRVLPSGLFYDRGSGFNARALKRALEVYSEE